MSLSQRAAEMLRPEHVVVAVDALIARLRRITQAVAESSGDERILARAARDHVAVGEAALNLLSVLHAEDPERAAVLRESLTRALDAAHPWFPA